MGNGHAGERPEEREPAERRTPGDTEREQARRIDDEHRRELRRARQAKVAKVLAIVVIAVLFIVFVIQNSQPVPVDFVFATSHPRLIWVIVASAALGGIVGYLIGRPGRKVRFHDRPEEK